MEKKIKEGLELYPAAEKTQLRSHDDFPIRENAMNSSNQMYLLN